jgi:hypothetical protein
MITLNHAIGRYLRADDRIDTRRQRLRRRVGWQGRWYRRQARLRRSDDEARAQEPVVGIAAAEATPEQIIVEGAPA